jgi:tetratricopeptide (TPR) repeat protein
MAPTSIYPLSEVENDHRMFFPFVGLVLSASWPLALWIYGREAPRSIFRRGVALVCCFELAVLALATVQRNLVWRTEESLWRDVTIKSPKNPKGLINYGITFLQKHDPDKALALFKEAQRLAPRYSLLEVNLGAAYGDLKQNELAEEHFRRGLQLDTGLGTEPSRCVYAQWLEANGRRPEAIEQLRMAVKLSPDFLSSVYLLMEIYAKRGSWPTVQGLADYILKRFPYDETSKAYVLMAAYATGGSGDAVKSLKTPGNLLNLSALYYEAGQWDDSIDAAREALALQPNYPEAYNNIAANYRRLEKWDFAIEASRRALALRPGYRSAQRNLAEAEGKKKLASHESP